MAKRIILSIDRNRAAAAKASGSEFDAASEEGMTVRFLDADGGILSERIAPPPRTIFFEHGDGDGGFTWSRETEPVTLDVDPPDGAVAAELMSGDAVLARTSDFLAALSADVPDPVSLPIREGAGWHLRIMSERFDDAEAFFRASRKFVAHMESVRPFIGSGLNWRATAHFWS